MDAANTTHRLFKITGRNDYGNTTAHEIVFRPEATGVSVTHVFHGDRYNPVCERFAGVLTTEEARNVWRHYRKLGFDALKTGESRAIQG